MYHGGDLLRPRRLTSGVAKLLVVVCLFLAVIVSGWLLYHELRDLSLEAVWASLTAIPPHRYLLTRRIEQGLR